MPIMPVYSKSLRNYAITLEARGTLPEQLPPQVQVDPVRGH